MKQIYANNCTTLLLGRQGENLARRVAFDVQDLADLYGPGTVELIYQRPGDEQPYPIAVERDGNTVLWTVNSADTSMANKYGECELRYYVGETIAKSKIWKTWVISTLETPSEEAPPEPQKGWVDQVLTAGAAAEKAAANAAQSATDAANAKTGAEDAQQGAETARDRAETAAIKQPYPSSETGTWWVWDTEAWEYKDSGQPTVGDGVQFTTDETLSLKNGVLSVNTAQEPEPDNTLPITSAAVHTTVGNIEVLLKTI